MLVNGKWMSDWQPVQAKDEQGRFIRQTSGFRNWVTPDGSPGPTGEGGFKAEAGRYRLYVGLICPWASRALMARKLKGLDDVIPITVVEPVLTSQGWRFGTYPDADQEPLFGYDYMHQLYTRADPDYSGRATVPVLWDMQNHVMVNNESADIVRMFNSAFDELVPGRVDLYPQDLAAEIEELNDALYDSFNNGVYKAGFASSQFAYEEAVGGVFGTLDLLEQRLSDGRTYLLGDRLTETDIRAFVTMIRFDAAYYGLFKTNRKQIADYPFLSAYMERVLRLPGISKTVNLNHIKAGYYSVKALNPSGIIPTGPDSVEQLLQSVG
ncbi:MAG: glutathione S-transferase family protein [Rhizobiaceae bacterium]